METINTEDTNLEEQPIIGTASLVQTEVAEKQEGPTVSPTKAAVRRFMRDKRAVVSLAVVLFIVIGSFVFPLIYAHLGPKITGGNSGTAVFGPAQYHNPYHTDLTRSDIPGTLLPLGEGGHLITLNGQSWINPLGTDAIGRDIFANLMGGINISIEIALMVEIVDIVLGVTLGTLAGWYGGWLGTLLDRFTDIVFAFPALLLILLMGATLGPLFDRLFHGAIFGRVVLLTLAIGLLAWPLMMRYVRGQTLQLKEQQFVEAARSVGTNDFRLIVRHVIPNLMSTVIVAATLDILVTIISEAGISALGAGLKDPATSLGLMIAAGTNAIYTSWTELFWPCAVLVILIVAFSFVGDGVRDAFDPRTKD